MTKMLKLFFQAETLIVVGYSLQFLFFGQACIVGASEAFSNDQDTASTLEFSAKAKLVSGPLCNDPKELRQFLERTDIRDLFLSAGGTRSCQSVPKDDDMMNLWKQACSRHYGPNAVLSQASCEINGDADFRATETSIHFPGFTTFNTVVSGCQRVPPMLAFGSSRHYSRLRDGAPPDKKHTLFEDTVHKIFLFADKKRWEGPAPLLWLIRQVADKDGTRSKHFQPTNTHATTIISVVAHERDKSSASSRIHEYNPTAEAQLEGPELYGFQLEIDFSIQMEFPAVLWRLLPASRSQVEERGNQAVNGVVLQDAKMVVAAVQCAWWGREHL
jgi:hypothetical protein